MNHEKDKEVCESIPDVPEEQATTLDGPGGTDPNKPHGTPP